MTPGLSTVLDAATVVTGKNLVTGEQVGMGGRALAFAGLVTPASGGELRGVGKIVAGLTERFGAPVTRALKNGASQLEWTNSKNGVKFIVRGPEMHPIKPGGPPVRHTNVEVHKPQGDGRFKRQGNAHLDDNGNVIP